MKFAITFQQKYNRYDEVHSVIPKVTGHSFLVLDAQSWSDAREKAFAVLGQDWAGLYELDPEFFDDIEEYRLSEIFLPDEDEYEPLEGELHGKDGTADQS